MFPVHLWFPVSASMQLLWTGFAPGQEQVCRLSSLPCSLVPFMAGLLGEVGSEPAGVLHEKGLQIPGGIFENFRISGVPPPPSKTPRESWRRRQCIVTLPSRPAHDEPPPKLGFR